MERRTSAPDDVAHRLRVTARERPDAPAILWRSTRISYADLDARVDQAAGALQMLGVGHGDRVALVLGNVPAFIEAYFGILRAGAVVVPLNTGLAPDELRHALVDSGAKVCVAAPGPAAAVSALAAELPGLQHIVVAGEDPVGSARRWRELLATATAPDPTGGAADDLAALVYTSGTTGRPRGAMLTRANLVANQDQSLAGRFRVDADDTVLLVLPLFHIYALNVGLGASVRAGAAMVLLERFDPLGAVEAIEEHRVTIVLGAPSMYVAWVGFEGLEDRDLSSIRLAVSGAAALPVPVLERFRARTGITILEGYGLTEAAPSVASNAMVDAPRPGSVGRPLPDVELRLVGDDGADVVQGDPGEVWVRGPNVFAGYWQDPAATADVLTEDGWLKTGDVGVRDPDGVLYLVDRKQDRIVVSGFNVYPREVERVLESHEAVVASAVVGIPHPHTGEAVRAYVVVHDDADVGEQDLIDLCRGALARYKCPSSIRLVPELPYTATGKVRRGALRDEG